MDTSRRLVPVASLALVILLAACTQAVATPSPSTAPPASQAPSSPASPEPSEPPPAASESPEESEAPEADHELPMIARVAADQVEVRAAPGEDSPILTGDLLADMSTVEIVLDASHTVIATLGPVEADGASWYEIASVDGGELNFAFGWVRAQDIEREGDLPAGSPRVVAIHGHGEDASAAEDVARGTPIVVRFAAAPTDGSDECEIEVTLVRTDGTAVNVATDTVTEPMVGQLDPVQLSSLFQEEAGTATLEVASDCSFAASMTMPAE